VEVVKAVPEREKTDESLREEREKTDAALAKKEESAQEVRDLAKEVARKRADDVLHAARDKADQKLGQPTAQAAVAEERAVEDATLRSERAVADEALRVERAEEAAAIERLLPLERQRTDRFLLVERARSDHELAHRDDFLAIASHDLRNLLGGIVMSAALLSRKTKTEGADPQLPGIAKRIELYAARMNRLIGDLVDVSSLDAGKMSMRTARGDLAQAIDEAADVFVGMAAEKGLAVKRLVLDAPFWVNFDHDRLIQVLANVIVNAIKFTPQGGTVVIEGKRTQQEACICVRDTGPGIPGEMLEAIFERFWQVGRNDRRGLGLGLYISRSIVEAHGGKIWAENNPGDGCAIFVTLPLAVS